MWPHATVPRRQPAPPVHREPRLTLLSDLALSEFCVDEDINDYSDNAYTAVMLAQIMTEADLDALDRAFSTFNYIND